MWRFSSVLFWRCSCYFGISSARFLLGEALSKKEVLALWPKILLACVPAGIVGILWSDELNTLFFNYQVVIVMLALFGILFLAVEKRNEGRAPIMKTTAELTYQAAQ